MLPFDSWPLGMVSLRCALHSIFSGGMPPVGGPRERILATESEDLLWRGSLEVTSLLTTSTSPKTSLMDIHLIYYWSLPRIENFLPPGADHSRGLALIISTDLKNASLEFLFSASGTTQSQYNLPHNRSQLTGIPWVYLLPLTLFFWPFHILHGF